MSNSTLKAVLDKIENKLTSVPNHYYVNYDIEDENGKVLKTAANQGCFASALQLIKQLEAENKKPAFIRHHLQMKAEKSKEFLRYAYYSGALFGATLTPDQMVEKKCNLVDFRKLTTAELYISLCNSRYVDEYPNFANSVVELVMAGIDFWHAFVYCHGKTQVSTGHSWLGYTGGSLKGNPYAYSEYASGNFTKESCRDINLVRYLKDAVLGKLRIGKELAIVQAKSGNATFYGNVQLVYPKPNQPRFAKDFFSDEVIALLHCNCEHVDEHIGPVS